MSSVSRGCMGATIPYYLPVSITRSVLLLGGLLALAPQQSNAPSDVKVTIDRNAAATATREFKFAHVASPAKDDAGAKATLRIVDGESDPNGAALNALVDGLVPREEDE